MDTIIEFISLALFIAFIIGLVKPSLVGMQTRKRSSAVYLGGCFLFVMFGSILYPAKKTQPVSTSQEPAPVVAESAPVVAEPVVQKSFKYGGKTLSDYSNESKENRHKIVNDYVDFKSVPSSAGDGFYSCMSEYTFTKDGKLKLGDVLAWCYGDYQKDPASLNSKINLDAFKSNFSGWDGSYRPLERLIKDNMNDDSSYKHVSTTYRLSLGKKPYAIVNTTFRGKNAYGGVIKQAISARVDVKTGDIIEIIDN